MKALYSLILILAASFLNAQTIGLTSFASGFGQFTEIKNAGDSRLFVVEKTGLIKIVNSEGTVNSTPFLNLSSLISNGSERGLLGLAFHPNYSSNGFFYVNYTNTAGNTVIARYTVNSQNANLANPTSATILLTITQPFSNHNGGCINFGPDGYLWISMGDGGSGGDPQNHAQNKNSLLGKMLRIDVNNGTNYSIPASNPFQGTNEKAEIWYTGLRNAWKFSFDSACNDVWIADVGQNAMEEINKVNYQTGGLNFGWKCYEGNSSYSNGTGCNQMANFTFPYVQYAQGNSGACSVTGGYVYRGTAYPNMVGKYFFADYCLARIGMVSNNATISYFSNLPANYITTFGQDVNGEIYVGSTSDGILYKLIDTSPMNIEDQEDPQIKLFPNPTSKMVNIEVPDFGFPINMKIYDLTGKVVQSEKLNSKITQINVQNLIPGVYVVDMENDAGLKQVSKLLIEN